MDAGLMSNAFIVVLSLLLGIVIGCLLLRWWQKQQESLPRKWHTKSEKDYSHCRAGVKGSITRVNQCVRPIAIRNRKKADVNVFQRKDMPMLVGTAPITA